MKESFQRSSQFPLLFASVDRDEEERPFPGGMKRRAEVDAWVNRSASINDRASSCLIVRNAG